MAGESVREMSSYREILEAAEAVHEALKTIARAHSNDDQGMHAACAVIDADHAVMAVRSLVELYEPAGA